MRIRLLKGLAFGLTLALFNGCGGARKMSVDDQVRAKFCVPVDASHEFEETPLNGSRADVLSFQTLRASLNSACASCHVAPAKNGGFTYVDSWQGQTISINGASAWYPGFSEAAEQIRAAIFHADPEKRMPPPEKRAKNPEAFLQMGRHLETWIRAGKPNGTYAADGKPQETRKGKPRPVKPAATSDLGDCVPSAQAIGFDYKLDKLFEGAKSLPKYLSDTDLFSLDPYALAQRGTVAYNVEYPLWADNAEKGRWLHIPMRMENGELKRQSISLDRETKYFKIPENTRFYKTFYRAIKLPNKKVRMRRVETRLIVARTPWESSLFGVYQWDDSEQIATLVEAPYRDGTPWKDVIFDIVSDEAKGTVRPYAIPGKQRCLDCHMGSPSRNGILGFQPLQVNKRPLGAAGRTDLPAPHDLDQVERLISYGMLSGVNSAAELPVLETSGTLAPQNVHELRANGYTVGNCFHCHNPNGLAFTKENGIRLGLGPGELFQFNTQQKSVQVSTRRLVHQNGELDGSQIWRKVSDSQAQLGMFSQMPMHTPGGPDCKVLDVMGKWIRSFESLAAAEMWQPECKAQNTFFWIDMDFTWPSADSYTPRRNDWKDPVDGMPERYRRLELSTGLATAIQTEIPVGYWLKRPNCAFPQVDLPGEKRRPWMMIDDKPKRPFGEIYATTPGAYFFRTTCMKCHGPKADGDTSLARGILNWSGGSVRVANLAGGMFGNNGANLKTFDLGGKNLAGQYLIWMAMEGTRVKFPSEISSFMGKHGGQMLNGIREKCLAQISTDKPSSPLFMDHEMFNKVCFMDNLEPDHPDLAFDPSTNSALYPDRVERWLDRGAWNAGWAIYEFLKEGAAGKWRYSNDQCALIYPKTKEPADVAD